MTVVVDFRTGTAIVISDPTASREIADAARRASDEATRMAETR